MIELRLAYASRFIELAQNAVMTGQPINRPIWWVDPLNTETFAIEDGNTILDFNMPFLR